MAVWLVLLGCCLWTAALCLPLIYEAIVAPISAAAAVGLSLDPESSWPTVAALVEPGADKEGLRHGDRLTAIDGASIGANEAALSAQLAGKPGTKVIVSARSPSGQLASHALIRDPDRYRRALLAAGLTPLLARFLPLAISYLLGLVLLIVCAIVLMVRRARDPLAPWASLMMLSMAIGNNLGNVFAARFTDPSLVYAVANGVAFSLLIIVLAVFPQGRFEPRWSLAIAVAGALLGVLTADLPNALGNSFLVILLFAAVSAVGVRYSGMTPGTGRQQIRWALLGFAGSTLSLAALIVFQIAAAATSDIVVSAWLGIAASMLSSGITALLFVGITVSLLRYRLYDADATISRSIVYGALTLSLLAIFAGSEKMIEVLGEAYFGERLGALAGGLGAAVAAVCIGPLHHRVTHWAEHRFRSGLVRLRDGLPLLVGDMRETATPKALAHAMLVRVEKGVRARHGAVVANGVVLDARDVNDATVGEWLQAGAAPNEGHRRVDVDRADPLFPVRVPLHADGVGLVGFLLLGPRPDGSFYGREERAALHEIAEPVARALAITIEREKRETARVDRDAIRDRELGRLGLLVDRLHARLGPEASNSDALA